MPLEITERFVTKDDKAMFTKPVATITVPYTPIYQWGYGRMDGSSPGKGLATSAVDSCIAVVFHCPTTGRTTLSHSPNFMIITTTFIPMIDWITGGDGGEVSMFDVEAWMSGKGAPGPREVQAVVMRGFGYTPVNAARYGHEGYMKDFRKFFDSFSGPRKIKAEIVDAPRLLQSGTVTVDKTTARITYILTTPSLKASGSIINITNLSLPVQYSPCQMMQDLFIGNLSYSHQDPVDIGLQFDGKNYIQALPLTDEARCLIRSKGLGEPREAQIAIVQSFSLSGNWLTGNEQLSKLCRMCFENVLTVGPPCERCGEKGVKKCGSRKGAWYCTAAHQKEDWPSHKTWCKLHKGLGA